MKHLLIFLLATGCLMCSNKDTSNQNNEHMNVKTDIILQAKLVEKEVHPGSPIQIEVVLKNNGDSSVVVNKRMAVGYRNSLSRELYVELIREKGEEGIPYYESDINRDFSPASDYVTLYPGESLSGTIDLLEFYTPQGPGTYRAILYYQADEALASAPEDVLKGVVESNPVNFEVLTELEKAE